MICLRLTYSKQSQYNQINDYHDEDNMDDSFEDDGTQCVYGDIYS